MERLTEKHYLAEDHYMKCSGNCHMDINCIDCPAVDRLVERLAAYEDTGLTPEEIKSAFTPDALIKLAAQALGTTPERLRELTAADKEGRVVVLPFTSGRTLLCEENIDGLRLMKDVELAIRYCSSHGIVFYMGYDVFCDLVKHGRITAVSEEAEKALEAMKDE